MASHELSVADTGVGMAYAERRYGRAPVIPGLAAVPPGRELSALAVTV